MEAAHAQKKISLQPLAIEITCVLTTLTFDKKINVLKNVTLARHSSAEFELTKVVKTQVISIGTQPAIQWSKPIRNTQLK